MTITFIGGGNMACALIGGLIARGASTVELCVVEPLPAQRAHLECRFPGLHLAAMVDEHAAASEVVVLAVKPQHLRDAVGPLLPFLVASNPVVLSIAAGVRLPAIASWLGGYRRLVRAMPNMPALVGQGIAGLHALPEVDARGRELAAAVLAAGGDLLWVQHEAMLDVITGVSGSGPAYVFYFLEALQAAACAQGFAAGEARQLAYATFSGAIALANASDAEPAVLRAQVTSKGGTTERALEVMEARGVRQSIIDAVHAAVERAVELGDPMRESR